MFLVLSRAWDKEQILSPHGESNLRHSDSVLWCSTTEPQRLYGLKTDHLSYSVGINLLYIIKEQNIMNGDVIYASVLPQEIIRKNQSNCEQKSAFYIINTR